MAADRVYGWVKDRPDPRDKKYAAVRPRSSEPLPASVDMRDLLPPCYNQGEIGSCTANAIAGALEHLQTIQHARERFTPSRLFVYYGERLMEGTVRQDAGAQIRSGIKFVGHVGAPPEELWPYEPKKFTKCPSFSVWRAAREHQALDYHRIDWRDLGEVKTCLAEGFPIVFGFTVFESFEADPKGWPEFLQPMPTPGEAEIGGHAVLAVGYDDAKQAVLVRNSWGPEWGEFGHFWMPYAYITSPTLSDDFWTLRASEV